MLRIGGQRTCLRLSVRLQPAGAAVRRLPSSSQPASAVVCASVVRCIPALGSRAYWGHNRIQDLMQASDTWHSLQPDRKPGDEAALRAAFNNLDLDGSGKIDKYELKSALLAITAETAPMVDDNVETMMRWADLDEDGLVDFEEYKIIIHAGCTPHGLRITPVKATRSAAAETAKGVIAGLDEAPAATKPGDQT